MKILLLSLLFVTGCASISELSQVVNDQDGYSVSRRVTAYRLPGAVSPSMATMLVEECLPMAEGDNGGKCKKVSGYSTAGTGYLPSLVGGGAAVGSSALIGRGLRDSGSGDSSVEVTAGSGSVSNAENTVTLP